MEKRAPIIFFLAVLLSLNFVLAINLEVKSKAISNAVITDLDKPAVFDLTIGNLEEGSYFEIFSLVGVDITPETSFLIGHGETKTIRIEVMPQESLKSRKGSLAFEYQIKNSKKEIQKEQLSIDISGLSDIILINPDDVGINSEKTKINIKNRVMYNFDDVRIKLDSVFLNYNGNLSFKDYENKVVEVPVNKDKLKRLESGNYLVQVEIQTGDKIVHKESSVRYLEKENIETSEIRKGIIFQKYEIIKDNLGNVQERVSVTVKKSILSYLFTTVNIDPSVAKLNGLNMVYTWEKDLFPGEKLDIIVKTNWLYLLIVIILIILVFIFIKKTIEMDLIFRKNVSFVKTKGGEFALKIHVRVKAKRFVERIKVIDKLPHLVSLYEKFGAIAPDNVDTKNKRLEWNIGALNKGEERIFSYIVYSKIGVFGKFELPVARAVYELNGKVKEATSNKSFFVNKPKSVKL